MGLLVNQRFNIEEGDGGNPDFQPMCISNTSRSLRLVEGRFRGIAMVASR